MMRYYRFAANSDSAYEAMRQAADARLGLSAPLTSIEPSASGPRDQQSRLLLAVDDQSPTFGALVDLAGMLATRAAEEITAPEYFLAFVVTIATAGGASTASDVLYGGGPVGNVTGATVEEALDSIDNDLENRLSATQFAASFSTGLAVSGGIVSVAFGTTSTTVCAGNDARLSNARTPTAHTHPAADIASGTLVIDRLPARARVASRVYLWSSFR